METVMLRMVSAVRRGFRTVFFKMSRRVFIAVLLEDQSRLMASLCSGNPGREAVLMWNELEANQLCKDKSVSWKPGLRIGLSSLCDWGRKTSRQLRLTGFSFNDIPAIFT
jgi:hypothetical protein